MTLSLVNNPAAGFNGTLTVNAINGVATFTNLAIDLVGSYTLQAISGSLTSTTSTSIAITNASAAGLVWVSGPPGKVTENIALGGTLDVVDQFGNLVPDSTATVSVALDLSASPDNGQLSGTTTAQAVAGVATFSNVIIDTIGDPFSLIASGTGLKPETSSDINVVAPQLFVTGQPGSDVTRRAPASRSP